MTKGSNSGSLAPIRGCEITIPGVGKRKNPSDPNSPRETGVIVLNNLPDISDSKSVVYNNEGIIGRSFPMYTFSHSSDRNINMQIHLFVVDANDGARNLEILRMIQSAAYPREGQGGSPYMPPPVCKIQCGDLLSVKEPLCCVLQSYSVRFPTDVAWESTTFCPYKFDIDTTWLTVYTSSDLPYQSRIVNSGR